nr:MULTISPECIES: glycosyltransferase [unclassified Staphylococcus]
MNINILGYNIFAKGGTSRSNINLIKSFLKNGNNVNYFNILDFESDDITRLIIHEGINNNNVQFYKFDDFIKIVAGDLLIITREELFIYAKEVNQKNKKIKIIGEIHGPLEYIDDSLDLGLEYIDSIRVSTDTIKEKFIKKYKYNSVFSQYVNAEHIDLKRKPINTKRNLLIKARFEDNIKDISYVIKLINYIVKNTDRNDIQLYIIGYGPSELLYKNLVKYYNLQNNVHINEKEPLNYIYISSSPYETLGYSILETLARGNRALIYPGDDNVLEEVYSQYNGIKFLEKNIRKDSVLITSILDSKYTKADREEDVQKLKATFLNSNYSSEYVNNLKNIINNNNMSKEFFFKNKYGKKFVLKSREKNELKNLNKKKEQFKKMKSLPILNKIFSNKVLNNKLKEHYKQKETNLYKQKLNEIIPQANKVFIESFHGNNFSGDPKYIALGIKNFFKDKEVFVSSINSLVDIEIRNHGFKPVRFGSKDYIEKFRMSKYIFIMVILGIKYISIKTKCLFKHGMVFRLKKWLVI